MITKSSSTMRIFLLCALVILAALFTCSVAASSNSNTNADEEAFDIVYSWDNIIAEEENEILKSGEEPTVPLYTAFDVQVTLLDKSNAACTNFVFPGKSLCNLLITQTVSLDMNLANYTQKARVPFKTPAFPVKGFSDLEMLSVLHINAHNSSESESCAVGDVVTGKDSDGTKNQAWKVTFFEKHYENPQLFQIQFKAVGVVQPLREEKKNSFKIQVISESVLKSVEHIGYTAMVYIPYKNVEPSLKDFTIDPTPTRIETSVNNTHTLYYENTGLNPSHNLTISMQFPEHYPNCLQIRWPTITMWSVVGSMTVIILVYVTVQCAFDQIKSRRKGYGELVEE